MALAPAAAPVLMQVWPLLDEQRCSVVEAAAQKEGMPTIMLCTTCASHRPCGLARRELSPGLCIREVGNVQPFSHSCPYCHFTECPMA